MRSLFVFLAASGLAVVGARLPARAAEAGEERDCIQVLQSARPPAEKDGACARLKRVGSAQAVPALAALLTDEQLSHSARYALESMAAPEAGRALLGALGRTTGLTKAGIINSLGFRAETQAVAPLIPLLKDPDADVAAAAAAALGKIGGPEALRGLETAAETSGVAAASKQSEPPVHDAIVEALLRSAQTLLASGNEAQARPIFERLYWAEKKDGVRVAAYRGLILASVSAPRGALPAMLEALVDQAGPRQTAALQLVREVQASGATEAFAQLLPKLAVPAQIALLEGLGQRGDMAAEAAIAPFTRHATPEVRLAAIDALGLLGGAGSVSVLAEAAAKATGAEQEAARQALVRLHHGEPVPAMLTQLTTAKPAVQAELARALGELGESAAFPKLLELARTNPERAGQAALSSLALLAGPAQIDALIQLVLEAKSDTARAQAAEAVRAASQRLLVKDGHVDVAPLVKALAGSSTEARIALLPVCSGLADAQVRAALRAALQDANADVRAAALRALGDTTDAELFPDLVKAACQTPQENLRTLAIAGCVRVATREESIKLPQAQKLVAFGDILAAKPSLEQKRLVLAGLGEIPDAQALRLAEPLLAEAAVQNEAGRAIIKIAPALPSTDVARAALKKALAAVQDAAARRAAETALKDLDARADYILTWQVAGPYRQEGKNYAALFDIPFAPEIPVLPPGAAAPPAEAVKWQPLAPSTDPARPWSMDLLRALGGEQCVAYARTWIHADQEQRARLELGSDDGNKVWLNGQLVHANNTARPLTPGSDKADATLKAGWNPLLLKITQNNADWEFCIRFLNLDGSHLEGLRFDANPHE